MFKSCEAERKVEKQDINKTEKCTFATSNIQINIYEEDTIHHRLTAQGEL